MVLILDNKGFVYDHIKYFESWIIFMLVSLLTPDSSENPSDIFILIISLSIMLLLSSICGFANEPRWILYNIFLAFVIIVPILLLASDLLTALLTHGKVINLLLLTYN